MYAGLLGAMICGIVSCGGTAKSAGFEQTVLGTKVLLLPPVEAGEGGWCIRLEGESCQPIERSAAPLVAESWSGQGPRYVGEGVVVTSAQVRTVSVDGGVGIPTRSEAALPQGLRVAVVRVRGGKLKTVPGFGVATPSPPPRFSAVGPDGRVILQRRVARKSLGFEVPRRVWVGTPPGLRAACRLEASPSAGVHAQRAATVVHVRPHRGIAGRPFFVCASTTYAVRGRSVTASVLVDASRPGSLPAPLPGMARFSRYRNLFEAPGQAGEMLARRIGSAWLAASGGDVDRRIALLRHLRVRLYL